MVFKVLLVYLKVGNRSFKLSFKCVVRILSGRFSVRVILKGSFNISIKFFKHTSNSSDCTSIKEHVNVSSCHLSKSGNNWGVMVRKTDFDTGSKKHGSVLGKLGK